MKKLLFILLAVLSIPAFAKQYKFLPKDASLSGSKKATWSKDTVYVVDGIYYVESGSELTIQAGTVVKFTERSDIGNPSALIVSRGAKIFANGTKDEPIIFTSIKDSVEDPYDLGPYDNALWGGLAILGKATTQKNGVTEVVLEGVNTAETRALYGEKDGNFNDNDNSGVMTYCSIRHGGRKIVDGSELNGLSLGAVGRGTKLEYIEVYANSDDGIEFFGGTVDLKHAIVAYAEDDSYDWDEAYTGKGQFWFSIQRPDIADNAWECDGSTPDDKSPSSKPTIYNATHIGSGIGATASNGCGWLLRAGTAGTIANSIMYGMKNKAIEVQDKDSGTADALEKLKAGELVIKNNIFFANGANTTMDATSTGIVRLSSITSYPKMDEPTAASLVKHLSDNKNEIADPMLNDTSDWSQNAKLDPRPKMDSNNPAMKNLATYPSDNFFTSVTYKGAFGPSNTEADYWLMGWSTLERNGHLKMITSVEANKAFTNSISIYPNPANGLTNLSFALQQTENLSIQVVNINGQIVRDLRNTTYANGVHNLQINMEGVAQGLYVVKISSNGFNTTKKLIIK